MNAPSIRFGGAGHEFARKIDWAGVWIWLLAFGLIAYLGLEGGGFDPIVHDQVGILVWWVVLAGAAVGALPNHRPGTLALTALGLFAAFVMWTALSLTWTESVERTSADLARVTAYLGVFAVALLGRDSTGGRRLVAATAAGIVFVAGIALLSRLHPDWFPAVDQTAQFLTSNRERLSYPLHYWNGLGALIAIGVPLVLQVATDAKTVAARAAAAAALPILSLAAFFTLSRGGIAAAAIAAAAFVALAPNRLAMIPTLGLSGLGSVVLILAGTDRDALQNGLLDATAARQGDELLAIVLIVCLAVAVLQAAVLLGLKGVGRPTWTRVSRRQSLVAVAVGLVVALAVAGAAGVPDRAGDAWAEFREKGSPGKGTERLSSVAGQNRYQLWSAAVKQNASEPLTGTGSGTYEYWWNRTADAPEIVRDAHSLYMQTLGELGIVGLALLSAFLLVLLAGGGVRLLRVGPSKQAPLAAAFAGCLAFCLTAAFDWTWQLPVLAVALMLLGPVLVADGGRSDPVEAGAGRLALRVGMAAAALAAIIAIAIPLASTSLVRQSEAQARGGDLNAALESARTAENVQPAAASPRLQQALVLEAQGEFALGVEVARAAAEREPTNWRTWFVLSRLEAENGEAVAAVRDYRKAKSLNRLSSFFQR